MTNGTSGWPTSRGRKAMWGGAVLLLCVPLVAMQFTREVDWDETDFIVMGAMLAAACGAFDIGARLSGSIAYRAGVSLAVLGAFLLTWLNLAVGIIGSENNPANLMFGAVLAVGIVGAAFAGFRAAGLSGALVAMALTQLAVGAIALIGNMGTDGAAWPRDVIVLSGFFTTLWLAAAGLFRTAARRAS